MADFFDFVGSVGSHIHVDVIQLYPNAELPRFPTVSRGHGRLVIEYVASRGLQKLAFGLLRGCSTISDEPRHITAACTAGAVADASWAIVPAKQVNSQTSPAIISPRRSI